MPVKFSNNAVSVTTTALATTDTVIALPAGHGAKFPVLGGGDWCYLTLVDTSANMEIVKATARAGDVLTVVRAQEGTTVRAFNSGTVVSHRLTAQAILDLVAGFATTTQLGAKADASALAAKAADYGTMAYRGAVPASANYNNLTTPGIYSQGSDVAQQQCANRPSDYAGVLEVTYADGATWVFQRYHSYSSGAVFVRRMYTAGSWSDWAPLHSAGAAISTAAPSGGYDGQVWYQV